MPSSGGGEGRSPVPQAGDGRLCPSARCTPGATLLGVVAADGVVEYVGPGVTVDETFVTRAREGRAPEKRFRFADACVRDRCLQWTGTRCGIIDGVLASPAGKAAGDTVEALPRCGIRGSCRWFAQEGPRACRVCPLVITDLEAEGSAGS